MSRQRPTLAEALIWIAGGALLGLGVAQLVPADDNAASVAETASPRAPVESTPREAAAAQPCLRVQTRRLPRGRDASGDEALLRELRTTVEKAGLAAASGTPMPWPDELPEPYRPDAFTRSVEELKTRCPDVFPPSTFADCSEFPCAVHWVSRDFVPDAHGELASRCPAFQEAFGPVVSVDSQPVVKDWYGHQSTRATPLPMDLALIEHVKDWRGNIRARDRYRREQVVDRVAASLGEYCAAGDVQACRSVAEYVGKRGALRAAHAWLELACSLGDEPSCKLAEQRP